MLVIRLKRGENVRLSIPPSSEARVVTVVLAHTNPMDFARIGFDAPLEIAISRSDAVEQSRRAAQ